MQTVLLGRYLSIGAATLGWSAAAYGQPAATNQLEEIVVTAERVEASLQRTPVSVTAFGAEDLRQRAVTNLLEMSAFTPNLVVATRSAQGVTQGGFAIRGMGIDATGSDAAVGVYIDDVYYPSTSGNILGVFDVERIEVLRGPQGTLFGRNTIAGAVQYVTAKPNFEFGGSIEAVAGDNERADINGMLNVPFGEVVAARFGFGSGEHGGYVHDDFSNVDRGEDDRKFGRVQVRAVPSEKLTVDVKLENMRHDSNGRVLNVTAFNNDAQFVSLARLFGEVRPYTNAVLTSREYQFPGLNHPEFSEVEHEIGQLVVDYDVSDRVAFRSISATSSTERLFSADFDHTPLSIIADRAPSSADVFTQEFRLSGRSMSERLSWTTGLFFYDGESQGADLISLGLAPALNLGGTTRNEVQSKAVYTQISYGFSDRLEGSIGVRYTDEEIDSRNLGDYVPAPGGPTPFSYGTTSTFDDTSPHVGLNFQATDDVMLYGKASKGFRAGGVNLNAGLPGGGRAFGPETAWTYEFGARMELADRRLRLNPTVFLTRWEAIQFNRLEAAGGSVAAITQNAGTADIAGLELETQFAATDRVRLSAALSYLDAQYDDVDNAVLGTIYPGGLFLPSGPSPGVQVPNLCDGRNDPPVSSANPALVTPALIAQYTCRGRSEMHKAPKFKLALGVRHTAPLSNGGSLATSFDYTHTDDVRNNVTVLDAVTIPSYALLSARVEYTSSDSRWSIGVFGTNLTDEYYLIGGADFAAGYTTGTRAIDPGRPRELGASFRVNF